MKSISDNQGEPQQIPSEFGDYMIEYFTEVLPPITWSVNYVLSSEPYSSYKEGRNTYIGFYKKHDKYYGVICSRIRFNELL